MYHNKYLFVAIAFLLIIFSSFVYPRDAFAAASTGPNNDSKTTKLPVTSAKLSLAEGNNNTTILKCESCNKKTTHIALISPVFTTAAYDNSFYHFAKYASTPKERK